MVTLHNDRFVDNAAKVVGFKYVLSRTALQWHNDLPVVGMPGTLNNLQHDFFAKFRVAYNRQEWKKEQDKCKYVPGTSSLPMLNRFQVVCAKPMNLRQFVVSQAHLTFAEVADSVKTYQELMKWIQCSTFSKMSHLRMLDVLFATSLTNL